LASKVLHHPSLSHAPLDTHHFSNQHHPASVSLTARQPVSSASCFPSTDLPNQPHQATSEASEWSSGGAATLCRWISYLLHVGLLYKGETFILLFVSGTNNPDEKLHSFCEIRCYSWIWSAPYIFINHITEAHEGGTAIIHGCNCSPTLLFWQDSSNFTCVLILYCWTHLQGFYFLFPSVRVGNMSSEWISLLASRIWMNFHLRFMFLHSGSYALMSLDFLFISLRLLVQVVCSNFHHASQLELSWRPYQIPMWLPFLPVTDWSGTHAAVFRAISKIYWCGDWIGSFLEMLNLWYFYGARQYLKHLKFNAGDCCTDCFFRSVLLQNKQGIVISLE
jgi:hypothetical protein